MALARDHAALNRPFGSLLDAEAAVAGACLTAIDELRDEYGPAGLEPRHPNIKTGRPWPVVP
jgi:hypothetical protein